MNKLTCLTIIAGLLACMNDGFAQTGTTTPTPRKLKQLDMWNNNANMGNNMAPKAEQPNQPRGNIAARWQNQMAEQMKQAEQDNKPKETLQVNRIKTNMWEEKN